MRRWIVFFVAGLVGLPLALHAIALEDSFVVFVFGQTTVEMPLWFVVAAMLCFAVVSYYGARFLRALLLAPKRVNRWFDQRTRRKVQSMSLRGYLALLEGNWTAASRDLQKAADKSEAIAALNMLLAAQARVASDDLATAEMLIRKVEEQLPEARVPLGIYQAQLLQKAGVPEKAHDILQTLAGENPRHHYLQALLIDSHRQRGDTQKVLQLLSLQHRQKPLQDVALITELCRLQVEHGDGDQAEALLRKQLGKQWRAEWVRLYGDAAAKDGMRQLQQAEKWLKDHPGDAELLLSLAHIAQRNRLWGKARDYYESYLALRRDAEAVQQLIRLLQGLGEQEKARQWQQKAAAAHRNTLPVPSGI